MPDEQLNLFEPSRVPGVERIALDVTSTKPPAAAKSLQELADEWMHTPGGRHIMRDLYAISAKHVARWRRTGIPLSIALVWEIERQRIKEVTARAQRVCAARGIEIPRDYGYTLNNSWKPYVARHMMSRRPEWDGLFETRRLTSEEDD